MKKVFRMFVVALSICAMIGFTSCQSCQREMKSIKSGFTGGLHRTLVLMDYEGDTIKVWDGKFDIRDRGADNQVFFDLDGKRVWIQGGIVISEEYQ